MGSITEGAKGFADVLKEKLKQNQEDRQTGTILDSIEQKIIGQASKDPNGQDTAEAATKSIDALRKAKLSPTQALSVGKMIAPDLFQSEEALAIKQGNLEQRKLAHQDTLEKQGIDKVDKILSNRSGGLGMQDAKVNSAFHALSVMDQGFDPKTGEINVPSYMQAELAANIANTISNQNVTSDAMRQDLMARNVYGDWNKTLQYITGSPKNSLPKDMFKQMLDTVVRQGTLSQDLRDNYINQQKDLLPSGLEPERAKRIVESKLGNDFKTHLNDSPVYNHFFGEKTGIDSDKYEYRVVNGKQQRRLKKNG